MNDVVQIKVFLKKPKVTLIIPWLTLCPNFKAQWNFFMAIDINCYMMKKLDQQRHCLPVRAGFVAVPKKI